MRIQLSGEGPRATRARSGPAKEGSRQPSAAALRSAVPVPPPPHCRLAGCAYPPGFCARGCGVGSRGSARAVGSTQSRKRPGVNRPSFRREVWSFAFVLVYVVWLQRLPGDSRLRRFGFACRPIAARSQVCGLSALPKGYRWPAGGGKVIPSASAAREGGPRQSKVSRAGGSRRLSRASGGLRPRARRLPARLTAGPAGAGSTGAPRVVAARVIRRGERKPAATTRPPPPAGPKA